MSVWASTTSLLVVFGLGLGLGLGLGATAQAARDEDESALLIDDGRAALARRDYDRAAAVLDRALAANPRRLDAYLLRASVYAARKDYAAGIALVRRARELAPDNLEVLSALGSQLVLAGQEGEGVPLLERVVKTDPRSYQAHALLGRVDAAHRRWTEATVELAAYLATRPPELAGQDNPFRLALADAELRAGHLVEARTGFEALAAADPHDVRARLGVAWATAASDCGEAAPLLDKLIPLADRVPDVLLVAGRCQLQLGHPAAARALAEKYVARTGSAAGHALRGEALLAGGDVTEAVRELETAEKLDRTSRSALWLARALRRSGDPRAAAAHLQARGEPEGADEPDFSVELGEDLLAAGDAAGAVARLEPIVGRFPDAAGAHRVLGISRLAAGDAPGALPELATAFRLEPDPARGPYARALVKVAIGDARAGRLAPAETGLARALEVAPDDPTALLDLGVVRLARGDAGAALVPLERAARGGKDGTALALYGRALAEAGRASEALLAFRGALSQTTDEERRSAIVLELAAAEIDAGAPGTAAAALQAELGRHPGRPRLEAAFLVAAQAAADEALAHGDAGKALASLEAAERVATQPPATTAVRCGIALAATVAGARDVALARLRQLGGARCPFAAPADELAVPLLLAANTEPAQAESALAKLAAMKRAAVGQAGALFAEVTRFLALRAAADAFAAGHGERARRLLAEATKSGAAAAPEVLYDQAVLDLDAGRTDVAIEALEKLAPDLPEASLALGLAWERKGDQGRALEALEQAQNQGVHFEPLAAWIAAKRRIHGGAP